MYFKICYTFTLDKRMKISKGYNYWNIYIDGVKDILTIYVFFNLLHIYIRLDKRMKIFYRV